MLQILILLIKKQKLALSLLLLLFLVRATAFKKWLKSKGILCYSCNSYAIYHIT